MAAEDHRALRAGEGLQVRAKSEVLRLAQVREGEVKPPVARTPQVEPQVPVAGVQVEAAQVKAQAGAAADPLDRRPRRECTASSLPSMARSWPRLSASTLIRRPPPI
jgi:hypothetical protein